MSKAIIRDYQATGMHPRPPISGLAEFIGSLFYLALTIVLGCGTFWVLAVLNALLS